MNLISVIKIINFALPGIAFLLASVHYVKLKKIRFLIAAAGAAIYLVFGILTFIMKLPYLDASSSWTAVFEVAALLSLILSVMQDERKLNIQATLFTAIIAVTLVSGIIIAALIANPIPPLFISLIPVIQLSLAVYAIVYVLLRKRAGRHYFFQTMLFLGIAFVLTIIGTATGNSATVHDTLTGIAYSFGFVSLILYIDTATSEVLGGAIDRSEIKAVVTEAFSGVVQDITQMSTEGMSREEIVAKGFNLIADVMQDDLGFHRVYYGRFIDEDCIAFHDCSIIENGTLQPINIELPKYIIEELKETMMPVTVSDTSTDPRTTNSGLSNSGITSFIALPVPRDDSLGAVLIAAWIDRLDSSDSLDKGSIEYLVNQIEMIISFLRMKCDVTKAPEIDAVTMLPNFSSFQRMLSDSIDEADKNSKPFALVFFDVDHFSAANAQLGFERGDQILRDIGTLLAKIAKPVCIGRVGSDEFAIILPGANEDVRELIEGFMPELSEKLEEMSPNPKITISVAFSIYPYDFFEKTGVFGRMREMLAAGRTSTSKVVRVKAG
ncbi:MAG TPA: sensor domain-containing diguanylate cyclase [bacterium]|nr:sensor domain-containing diguanylate cyclase [bacterium]